MKPCAAKSIWSNAVLLFKPLIATFEVSRFEFFSSRSSQKYGGNIDLILPPYFRKPVRAPREKIISNLPRSKAAIRG